MCVRTFHFPSKNISGSRLELDLVDVDSTRAGKRLPDASPSKTVSIWCAATHLSRYGLIEAPSLSSSSPDIAAAVDFSFNYGPAHAAWDSQPQAAKSPRGSTTGPWLSQTDVLPPPSYPFSLLLPCSPSLRKHTQDSLYALPELGRPLRPF